MGKKLVAVLGLIVGLGASQSAAAQSRSLAAREAEEAIADPDRSPFSGSIGLGTVVGSGTFISDQYSDDPLVMQNLNLGGSYRIDGLPFPAVVSLRQGFSYEYTQPGARNGRKWNYSDPSISISSPSLWNHEETKINLSLGLSASLPISFGSRASSLYTTIGLGPALGMPVGDFYFSLGGGVSKSFHKYTNLVNTQDEVIFGGDYGAHCREGATFCRGGPFLTSWAMSLNGGVYYSFLEKFNAGVSAGWSTSWSYSHEPDEFSSTQVPDPGRNRRPDIASVGTTLSYMYSPLLSVSAGLSTAQPILTGDQKGIRNPLYSRYLRDNSTTMSLNLSAGF